MNWRFISFVLLLWTLIDGKSTGNDDPLPAANQNSLAETVGKSIDKPTAQYFNFLQKDSSRFFIINFISVRGM
jgi:hypothetical protein